jgi:hypothetical protein
MKAIIYGLAATVLAALSAGCAYSERTAAVAVPGAEYSGDRYYSAPSTAYVYTAPSSSYVVRSY